MNLYERLKVTQDAPPEVIRAAYRALAQTVAPDEVRQARLTALNEAYETLIDPQARAAYDATWRVAGPDIVLGETGSAACAVPTAEAADAGLDITLDALLVPPSADAAPGALTSDDDLADPWQSVYDAPPVSRPRSWVQQPLVWAGGALAVLAIAGAGVWGWQLYSANRLAEGMAAQMGVAASGLRLPPESVMPPSADEGARTPSVAELSRMSDEELLNVLPTLNEPQTTGSAQGGASVTRLHPGRGAFAGRHPLDGAPLNLRTEGKLVDPLAPEVPSSLAPRQR